MFSDDGQVVETRHDCLNDRCCESEDVCPGPVAPSDDLKQIVV